jgi:FkbM family methyltransferase
MRPGYTIETRCYLRLIRKNACVFDVGANNGHYTMLYSDLVGPGGQVHAFEPVPKSAGQLRTRIAQEAIHDNITLNEVAVTDVSGLDLKIGIPNQDFGQASLAAHAHGSWRNGNGIEYVGCRTVTLDDYAAEQRLASVDFIKIDVEGAELLVLKGARKLLGKFRPIVHLEYFGEWTSAFGYGLNDLVSFLEDIGYRNYYFDDLRRIENIQDRAGEMTNSTNLVCSAVPLRPAPG